MKYLCLILIVFVTFNKATAQQKDTLKEVKVTGKLLNTEAAKLAVFSKGQKVTHIDSETLAQFQGNNLAALLAQQTPAFIKVYNFNGLATLNFRGSSAAQSQVLWNGVPIQNAALGIADISTLPVALLSKVSIVYGGSAALWGSGNVGGALLLDDQSPDFRKNGRRLSLSAGGGSFGQLQSGLSAAFSGEKYYFSVKATAQEAKNNFPYTNSAGASVLMPNGQLRSGSVMVSGAFRTGAHDVLSISGWLQSYYRETPPALFEAYSVKKRTDAALRLLANWEHKTDRAAWYVKSAFTQDDSRYSDDAIAVNTNATVYQYFGEAGFRKSYPRFGSLLVFAPVQIAWMSTGKAGEVKQQERVAIAGAYHRKLLRGSTDLVVNMRAESAGGNQYLLPGASASTAIDKWLTIRANVQRTYRLPTLNELYYFPGGNTALKPEYGWNEDAGYTCRWQKGDLVVTHDLAIFNRNIHDWILWLGGAVWTPHNIAEVHSRGVETENKALFKIGKYTLHAGINTGYVLATTVSSYVSNDGSIGKQIPYTPRYNGQINLGCAFGRYYFNYNHGYTGYRFNVVDESAYQSPYSTANIQASYQGRVCERQVIVTTQCNNIWNQRYEIVAYRPMPGINWLAGVRLEL